MNVKNIDIPYVFIPVDEEGYTKSFTVDQLEEAKAFFDEFGFVVGRDVLSEEACEATISEIFDVMEERSNGQFDRRNTGSWSYWPEESIEKYGNVSKPSMFTRQFMLNRMNPDAYAFCAAILEDDELVVSHDRACFFRPTVDVTVMDRIVDKPEWKTATNLHLDLNPWHFIEEDEYPVDMRSALTYYDIRHWISENNFPTKRDGLISLQGSFNLSDNREDDGGFVIVPGFQKVFEDYFSGTEKMNDSPSYYFHYKNAIRDKKIRVTSRAGSIILWDQRMPHGSERNKSCNYRTAQFFRMFKKSTMTEERATKRRKGIRHHLNAIVGSFEITELGLKLFDLDDSQISK